MSEKQITIPIYDIDGINQYRLYYDTKRFEVEEYNRSRKLWIPTRKDPDMLIEQIDFTPKNIMDFAEIQNSIPEKYQKAVSKYQFRKAALLTILHRSPGLLDILKDAPVIGLMLADSYGKGNMEIAQACELVYKPRTEILKSVGCIGTKSQVKLLSKIRYTLFDKESFGKICRAINDDSLRDRMSKFKLKYIDEKLVEFMSSNEALLDYAIICNGIESLYGHHPDLHLSKDVWNRNMIFIKRILWETHKLIDTLPNNKQYIDDIIKCSTIVNLFRYLPKLQTKIKLNQVWHLVNNYGTNTFPPPPIEGNDNIKPIVTINDLVEEATQMNHCVSNCAESIYKNKYYVYKVLQPQRATLGISINSNISMSIHELKLRHNGIASDETWGAVKNWFENNRINGQLNLFSKE